MLRYVLSVAALFASIPHLSADSLSGAWRLQQYMLDGKDVPVSGTLIFSEDHFGMVYQMGATADSGRGHGGTYRVEENRILFSIPFWLQHVDGASRVMTETSEAIGRFEVEDDELRIRFENDALQRFKKAPASTSRVDGAWNMAGYESEAKTGDASGLALFESGNFVLIYTMATGSPAPDARAHAGGFDIEGDTLTLKVESSIHCVGGAGRVERTPSPRDAGLSLERGKLDLEFKSGARMSFVQAIHEGASSFAYLDSGLGNGIPMTVWTYRPPNLDPDAKIVFVLHGTNRDLMVMLGEEDVDESDPDLRGTQRARAQGRTRLARGDSFHRTALATAARLGVTLRWRRIVVPGAGHSNRKMAEAAVAILVQ